MDKHHYLQLNEVMETEEKLLREFSRFCEEHELKYYLAFGTLIGAVRHKGFIPWDDDIDVMMPREDYEKFLKLYQDPSGRYEIGCIQKDKKYPYASAKFFDALTRIHEYRYRPYRMGIYIDIFPLDSLGNDMKKIKRHILYIKIIGKILDLVTYDSTCQRTYLKKFTLAFLQPCMRWINHEKLIEKMTISNMKMDSENPRFCGVLTAGRHGLKQIYRTDWFEPYRQMEFENNHYRVPYRFDKVLKREYGDYMQLPPPEQQVTHHSFDAWRVDDES